VWKLRLPAGEINHSFTPQDDELLCSESVGKRNRVWLRSLQVSSLRRWHV
jgi:hypothetical protein